MTNNHIISLSFSDDYSNVTETNYFESPVAQRGFFFLAVNNGMFHLLTPSVLYERINDVLSTTSYILLTKGEMDGSTCYEILFEDHSKTPFAIYISFNLVVPQPSDDFINRKLAFKIWAKPKNKIVCIFNTFCYYRKTKKLPYLKPLSGF